MEYRLIEKQVVYNGSKIRLEVHRLVDDNNHQIKREICVHNGAVVILPFLPDGRVLLIRNHRYSINEVLIELPAGTLEKNEDPMNCAGRELQEETGYLAGRLQAIGSFYTSPGILTEKMHAFAAFDLIKSVAALEQGEEIEVFPVPFEQAVRMTSNGEIHDGKTICTLLLYDRFHRASK